MNILSCLYWVDSEAKRFMDKQGLYSATYVVNDTRSMTEYIGMKTACLHYVVLGELLVSLLLQMPPFAAVTLTSVGVMMQPQAS